MFLLMMVTMTLILLDSMDMAVHSVVNPGIM